MRSALLFEAGIITIVVQKRTRVHENKLKKIKKKITRD